MMGDPSTHLASEDPGGDARSMHGLGEGGSCPGCGSTVVGGAKFCPSCGARLEGGADHPGETRQPEAPAAAPVYAGLGARALAGALDALILSALWFALYIACCMVWGLLWFYGPELDYFSLFPIVVILSVVLWIPDVAAYESFFLVRYGATPGKRLLGIVVRSEDGGPVTFKRALARSAGLFVSCALLGLGFVVAAFDGRRRTLHDRIAGTIVLVQPGAAKVPASANAPAPQAATGRDPGALAGFWIRAAAFLVDALLLFGAYMAFLSVFFYDQPIDDFLQRLTLLNAMVPVIPCLYHVPFLALRGATPGKMLMGLRVKDESGGRVSPGRAVARTVAFFLSLLFCGLPFILAAFDERRQALHDKVAGTLVVNA